MQRAVQFPSSSPQGIRLFEWHTKSHLGTRDVSFGVQLKHVSNYPVVWQKLKKAEANMPWWHAYWGTCWGPGAGDYWRVHEPWIVPLQQAREATQGCKQVNDLHTWAQPRFGSRPHVLKPFVKQKPGSNLSPPWHPSQLLKQSQQKWRTNYPRKTPTIHIISFHSGFELMQVLQKNNAFSWCSLKSIIFFYSYFQVI